METRYKSLQRIFKGFILGYAFVLPIFTPSCEQQHSLIQQMANSPKYL